MLRLIVLAIAIALASPAGAADPAPSPGDPPPTATMSPVDPGAPQLPARIDDGSRVKLPPMVIAPARPPVDRRPIYLGAGLVVLAAVFWWNRRRRDRFEHEDQGGVPPRPPRRPRRRDADPDADDLHAAARGDGPADGDPHEPERPDP